jgi:hypothetical protein
LLLVSFAIITNLKNLTILQLQSHFSVTLCVIGGPVAVHSRLQLCFTSLIPGHSYENRSQGEHIIFMVKKREEQHSIYVKTHSDFIKQSMSSTKPKVSGMKMYTVLQVGKELILHDITICHMIPLASLGSLLHQSLHIFNSSLHPLSSFQM